MSLLLYLAGLSCLAGVSYSTNTGDYIGKYQLTIPNTFNSVQFDYDADTESVKVGFSFNYVLYLEQSNGDDISYTTTNNRNNVYTISNVTDFDNFIMSIYSITLKLNNFDIYLTGQSGMYFGYDLILQYNNSDDILNPNTTTLYTGYFSDYLTPVDGSSNHTIIGTNNDNFLFGEIISGSYYDINENNLQSTFDSGYALGYGHGYSVGERDGYTEGSSKLNGSWVDWIISAVKGFFDTPIFGEFTLGGILTTILGAYLMIYILKVFAGA